MYPNIDKSPFRNGGYTGYGGGQVWLINRTNSSYGNWCARQQNDLNQYIYAFTLRAMSEKLSAIT